MLSDIGRAAERRGPASPSTIQLSNPAVILVGLPNAPSNRAWYARLAASQALRSTVVGSSKKLPADSRTKGSVEAMIKAPMMSAVTTARTGTTVPRSQAKEAFLIVTKANIISTRTPNRGSMKFIPLLVMKMPTRAKTIRTANPPHTRNNSRCRPSSFSPPHFGGDEGGELGCAT